MSQPEDLPDRRARVQGLLRFASAAPTSEVELSLVPGNPSAVVDSIDAARLMGHVQALTTEPRYAFGDQTQMRAAASYVERELGSYGLEPQSLDAIQDNVTMPVVWAAVASDVEPDSYGNHWGRPRPVVVLVAHYDTVEDSPGADDNASGVAGLLEIARTLPRKTLPADVILAAVPFEEKPGELAGSAALAAYLDGREDVDVVAAVSAEMLGFSGAPLIDGDAGDDLLLVGFPGTDRVIDTLVAAADAWSPGRVRGLAAPQVVREIERSDHASFHHVGVPAVMATDGAEFRNPHYHRPSDTIDTLDPEFLVGATASLAVGLMALASMGGSQRPRGRSGSVGGNSPSSLPSSAW